MNAADGAAQAPAWLHDLIPHVLHAQGPGGMLLWQWLGLPVVALVSLGLGRLLGSATLSVFARLVRRTRTEWDDLFVPAIAPSVGLLWAAGIATLLLPWLALDDVPNAAALSLLGGVATLALFWALWRSVDVAAAALAAHPSIESNPSTRSLLSAGRNLVKAMLFVAGVVSTLAVFGYPVATVLTGLGIGGVALAFGAQKTVENLFGSVSLAVDQPCRVGDFVRIEDFVGTVERIGMRSTQVRTLDRTLITLPNGRLSDMRIETFAARDRIRLSTKIGVVYGTTEEQMQRILAGIEKVLRDHPHIWPDTVVVRFVGFGASSLDVEIMCWFETTDFNTFRDYQQEALLGIMRVVEEAGTSFAFPTQTLHLVNDASRAGGGGRLVPHD